MVMMNGMEYTGMDAILAGSFRAAIYCRLSKDDDLDGESASIANQRDMLESYCEKQGWEVVAVYQDDGYTGLNMERPDLKRMLKAIERRQINLVVTKDLSRLGRNYLQTGFLIEDFFPRNGVSGRLTAWTTPARFPTALSFISSTLTARLSTPSPTSPAR